MLIRPIDTVYRYLRIESPKKKQLLYKAYVIYSFQSLCIIKDIIGVILHEICHITMVMLMKLFGSKLTGIRLEIKANIKKSKDFKSVNITRSISGSVISNSNNKIAILLIAASPLLLQIILDIVFIININHAYKNLLLNYTEISMISVINIHILSIIYLLFIRMYLGLSESDSKPFINYFGLKPNIFTKLLFKF